MMVPEEIYCSPKIKKLVSDLGSAAPKPLMSQPAFTCSESTMETPEQCVKSAQS